MSASDSHRHIRHVIHGDHFIRAHIQRLLVVTGKYAVKAFYRIVYVAERAGLQAVTPHLEFRLGAKSFAQECRGGLLATTAPGAVGAIDVVKAHDTELDLGEVHSVPPAALLRDKLLKAVGILGVCRPRILFLKTGVGRVELLMLGVDAGAGGVQESLHTILARCLDHVERDHGVVVQDPRVVRLDEAHASHISSKVKHPVNALGNLEAVV
mmetsp:Transcript_1725/g.2799  ORF Transcript_1725/g.2799 Transcript_1725/m.2799 type:complete len:211 (-) Transcript_1725:232-864(-)